MAAKQTSAYPQKNHSKMLIEWCTNHFFVFWRPQYQEQNPDNGFNIDILFLSVSAFKEMRSFFTRRPTGNKLNPFLAAKVLSHPKKRFLGNKFNPPCGKPTNKPGTCRYVVLHSFIGVLYSVIQNDRTWMEIDFIVIYYYFSKVKHKTKLIFFFL